MASHSDDYDDVDTDTAVVAAESPRLCAMISIDGVVTTKALPDVGDVTIGRDASCDIVIPHASVSRQHAKLRMSPLEIADAGSRNGTRVRGADLEPHVPVPLAVGEAVQIGRCAVLIHSSSIILDDPLDDGVPDHSPESFARMFEMECARSARSRSPFSFVRVEVREGRAPEVGDVLRSALRTSDAISTDGPNGFQLLLLDTSADQTSAAVARMTQLLAQTGLSVKVGIARYPQDGVTAAQLSAHAWERLSRPPHAPPTEMDHVRTLIAQIAHGDVSVLITGETGVGKELCAEMIHRLSARAGKPFVKLNCASVVESLIESELFGHERGAFTGAITARPGLFEAGNGGTVFLDEIGELPLSVQSKLLRVLEEREVRRVGATVGKTLDVRFVCATNRVLADEVAAGRFRRDLYYRINGVTLSIPPLRERRSEIAGLAKAFARRSRPASQLVMGADVIDALEQHPWPGNIRELRNTIERAVLLSSGGSVRVAHLALENEASRAELVGGTRPTPRVTLTDFEVPRMTPDPQTLANAVAELERKRILDALNEYGGNQTRAARALGISRNTLLSRLDAYGLPRPRKS
ncbi:MAG: sigma 54-interacting transcriptional regulator [Kofleriaceae bacterium]|nr:sigma 54-interacting transcriptional regulator [Kofleriaceae bacterium]